MPDNITLQLKDIRKTFRVGIQDIEVLKGITFDVYKSDFLLIFGPSGCGKSTLLHTLLGLEPPTSGSVIYFGNELYGTSTEDERSTFRKKSHWHGLSAG